ncbi:esterase/lipase family protein [Planctomicrobium sp. SH668]|uniref:esterase/lipase family protein n=1 Tax=Planctomicrobium sp. SH668 TaxID=3448126 RepID=UPI003F5B2CD8
MFTQNRTTTPPKTDQENKGTVILIHGLGASSWLMTLLAYRLRLQGYSVVNWGYRSVWQSLSNLIPEFRSRFEDFLKTNNVEHPVHIVAHSMGSIIARAVLSEVRIPNLQNVVLLSPPNRGSFFARWVGPYLRWLSPLIDELSDRDDSYVNQLPMAGIPKTRVGIIAAEWDYVLTEKTTHLDFETDHIIVPSRHSGLVLRNSAAQQIIHFLSHGGFNREVNNSATELQSSPPASNL